MTWARVSGLRPIGRGTASPGAGHDAEAESPRETIPTPVVVVRAMTAAPSPRTANNQQQIPRWPR